MGLATAYQLAALGCTDVVVLEGHHLAWGASGRNGGGVRQQWSTELNIRLMQESMEICRGFAQELGVNIWMRQGGYLFLARSTAQLERMRQAIALQNACDVPTRLLDMAEARRIVPELDDGPFAGACYNPTDAIVFPWPFLWGYARAAARRGVEIHTRTPVTAITPPGRGLRAVDQQGRAAGRADPDRRRGLVGRRWRAWSGCSCPPGPCGTRSCRPSRSSPSSSPWSRCSTRASTSRSPCAGRWSAASRCEEPRTDAIELGSRLALRGGDGGGPAGGDAPAGSPEGGSPVGRALTTCPPTARPSSGEAPSVPGPVPLLRLRRARLHDGARGQPLLRPPPAGPGDPPVLPEPGDPTARSPARPTTR